MLISFPPVRYNFRPNFNMVDDDLLQHFTSPLAPRAFNQENIICLAKKDELTIIIYTFQSHSIQVN